MLQICTSGNQLASRQSGSCLQLLVTHANRTARLITKKISFIPD